MNKNATIRQAADTEASGCAKPTGQGRRQPGWLFVLPWSLGHIGGVNEVVKSLIRGFREIGAFSPELLITGEKTPAQSDETELIRPHHLSIWSPVAGPHPVRSFLSFLCRFPYRCWILRRIVRRHDVQVVNPHFPDLGCIFFVLAKQLHLFSGKIILSFHLSDIRSAETTRGVERRLWKMLLRHADHIIVVSDDLGKEILALEPDAARTLKTIYNGVDLDLFSPAKRQGYNQNDSKIIVSVGAFLNRKGHDVLVRAFERVTRKMPDTRLIIVGGDGPEAEAICQLVDALSLTKSVALYRGVRHERIPEFLSQATLFALASRGESFGLVVTEAAAMKVPVVCTRATGLRELITDGVTGRLVDVDDHISLAEAILDLLMDPCEAQRMATNFYENIRSNLTWSQTCSKYIQVASQT